MLQRLAPLSLYRHHHHNNLSLAQGVYFLWMLEQRVLLVLEQSVFKALVAPYVSNDPCLYNSFLTAATFSPNDQFIQHITKQALAQTTSQCNSNAN